MTMEDDISIAAAFLVKFVNFYRVSKKTNCSKLKSLTEEVMQLLIDRYQGHWFPDKPIKGSAYRCLEISKRLADSEMASLFASADLPLTDLCVELTMWVDPGEVHYRLGEQGSVARLSSADDQTCQPRSPHKVSSFSSFGNGHAYNTSYGNNGRLTNVPRNLTSSYLDPHHVPETYLDRTEAITPPPLTSGFYSASSSRENSNASSPSRVSLSGTSASVSPIDFIVKSPSTPTSPTSPTSTSRPQSISPMTHLQVYQPQPIRFNQ